MTMPGWLWLNGEEVLNDGRFLANVPAALGSVHFTITGEACPAFMLDPTDGYAPLTPGPAGNPWHDPLYPKSDEFYGFWLTDGGLNAALTHDFQDRSIPRGGANRGRLRRGRRELPFTVLLAGEDMAALRWGYDWLAGHFDTEDPCEDWTALVRLHCADEEDPTDGLWELREVGIVDAPKWGESPVKQGGCVLREVEFTLSAGDPYRYAPVEENLAAGESMSLNTDGECGTASTQVDFLCPSEGLPDQRIVEAVTGPGLRGQRDVNVLIDGATEGAAAMLIRAGADPEDPDTEVGTCRLHAGERLLLDSSRQRLWFDEGDGLWRDGAAKFAYPTGTDPWITFRRSEAGEVWVEPANLMGHTDTAEVWITTRTKVGV